MKLKELEVEHFGPFFEKHTLDFSASATRPLVVVHGENLRGKTSLLNAVRWCLYGEGLGRGGKKKATVDFMNYDALKQGDYHMSATLKFEHQGSSYVLKRHVQADAKPSSDKQLAVHPSLQKDGKLLPEAEIDREIGSILHKDVARFFFFDGEMLDKYEILLQDPTRDADLVKQSIEQILGLPSIQLAVNDLDNLSRAAQRKQVKALAADQKHQELIASVAQVENELGALEGDMERLLELLDELETKKSGLQDRRAAFVGIQADIRQLESLEDSIEDYEDQRDAIRTKIRILLAEQWWIPASSQARDIHQDLHDEVATREKELLKRALLADQVTKLQKASVKGSCPTCKVKLSPAAKKKIDQEFKAAKEELWALDDLSSEMESPLSRMRIAQRFSDQKPLAALQEKENLYRKLGIDQRRTEREWEQIRERLTGHDRKEIREVEDAYDEVVGKIKEIENDFEEVEKSITSKRAERARLQKEIAALPEADAQLTAEAELFDALKKIFSEAVHLFRDRLREEVEREATDVHRMLSTEPEYERLEINDNYGLRVVDSTGQTIHALSAGGDQIVALSLIGALNQCASRDSTIIMDTPFGRLDRGHRKNILKFIPTMGTQVVLLVQSGELDKERDADLVEADLAREYRIERAGPTRSQISPLT